MAATLKEALEIVKQNGLKMSVQRKMILEYLYNHKNMHPSAEEIFLEISKQLNILSPATVYNNLKHLKQYGLVKEVYYQGGATRYDNNLEKHHHLICIHCGKIIDFYYTEPTQLQEVIQNEMFSADETYIEIRGTCHQCASSLERNGAER